MIELIVGLCAAIAALCILLFIVVKKLGKLKNENKSLNASLQMINDAYEAIENQKDLEEQQADENEESISSRNYFTD